MPQIAIAKIAAFLVTLGIKAAIATFIAEVFVYAAIGYLLSRLSQPKKRGAGLGSGTELNYYDSGATVRILYGEMRVGGMETIPAKLSGSYDEYLHKVLTIAGHEVSSYRTTYFDTIPINNSFIGPVAFTSSDGQVTNDFCKDHAWVRRYRGTSTDSADRILCDVNSTLFGRSRAPGIAKVCLTYKHDPDIWKSLPSMTFLIQGKSCYDPRLDPAPGVNISNPAYKQFTSNPAVCLTDYLMASYGGSYEAADIDWTTVVTAANVCDLDIDIPGAITRKRYTCNGVLFATDGFGENIRALVDCMLGRIIFRDGKWRMFAGAWQSPSFTIQKADWVSALRVKFEQGRVKRFNRMHCWYVDQARDWQRVECMPRINTIYKAADGDEDIDRETEQLMCTNEYEAQAKAEMLLRQSRNQVVMGGRLPPKFQDIALWDTGTIVFDELGFESKTVRCTGIDLLEDGSMDIAVLEEEDGDWTDLTAGEYNTQSVAELPLTNESRASEPRNLTVTEMVNGTLLFNWDPPIVRPLATRFQIIRSTNSADATVGTVVYDGNAAPVALVQPTSRSWYYMRSVIGNSYYSAYHPSTYGVAAIARVLADNTRTGRLVPDGEFEFGAATSMWTGMNIGATHLNDVTSINWVNTYIPTGGQAGGYVRFTATNSTSGLRNAAIVAMNPQNSMGYPVASFAGAYKFNARLRVNSWGSVDPGFGIIQRFRTAVNSNASAGKLLSLSSLSTPLGQWVNMSGILAAADSDVSSVTERYLQAAVFASWPAQVEIDKFELEQLGLLNQRVTAYEYGLDSLVTVDESRCVVKMIASNTITNQTFDFWALGNASDSTFDWRRWVTGRSFEIVKTQTMRPVYIIPSSGMTLELAGRTAVGTVTMAQSLQAGAVITKVDYNRFSVVGNNLS